MRYWLFVYFKLDCRVSPSRVKNEVVREPSPAPIIQRDVQRIPTPEPDVIERVYNLHRSFHKNFINHIIFINVVDL